MKYSIRPLLLCFSNTLIHIFLSPLLPDMSLLECLLCAIICPGLDSYSSHSSSARSGSRQHPHFIDKQPSPAQKQSWRTVQLAVGSSHLGLQEHRCCLVLVHALQMGPLGVWKPVLLEDIQEAGPGSVWLSSIFLLPLLLW